MPVITAAHSQPLTDSVLAVARRIVAACHAHELTAAAQWAYALATTEHETGGTFQPVREACYLGAKAEAYRKGLAYYPFYGRGYVQITWRTNYRKFGALLGIDLEGKPDLAMVPATAAWILAYGFKHGTFTGKRMEDYITAARCDFRSARRCINGLDRADHIAGLAKAWLGRIDLVRPA
jgi:predicted chitinase